MGAYAIRHLDRKFVRESRNHRLIQKYLSHKSIHRRWKDLGPLEKRPRTIRSTPKNEHKFKVQKRSVICFNQSINQSINNQSIDIPHRLYPMCRRRLPLIAGRMMSSIFGQTRFLSMRRRSLDSIQSDTVVMSTLRSPTWKCIR